MSAAETQTSPPPASADPVASDCATATPQDPYFSRDFSSLITLATSLESLLTRWTQTSLSAPTPPPLTEISDATQALHRLTSIRKTILTLDAWLQQPPPAPPDENAQRKEEQARQREHLRRISADVTILEESLKADLALWRMRETYPAANHFPPLLAYPPGPIPEFKKSAKSKFPFASPVPPPLIQSAAPSSGKMKSEISFSPSASSARSAVNSPIRTVPTAPLCPTISAAFPGDAPQSGFSRRVPASPCPRVDLSSARATASPRPRVADLSRGSLLLPSQEPLRVEQPSQFSPCYKSNPPIPRAAPPKPPPAASRPISLSSVTSVNSVADSSAIGSTPVFLNRSGSSPRVTASPCLPASPPADP